jgi:hypothetical protein
MRVEGAIEALDLARPRGHGVDRVRVRPKCLRRSDGVQLELISNFEMARECCGGWIEMGSRGL